MTTELDRLISDTYHAMREETAARLRRKHDEAATQITKDTERLHQALTTYLGDAIVHALFEAGGTVEVWMRTLKERIAFTPEAWEREGFPEFYVVLAFTYRGCRLHLRYINTGVITHGQGEWTLSLVESVTDQSHISYSESRSMLASDRQRLLLMIDGLANVNNKPDDCSES